MGNKGASLRIACIQCEKNLRSPRIVTLVILMGLYIVAQTQPIGDFARAVGYPVSPFAFCFLANDLISQMIMMAGVIVLFCDAPFRDDTYPYLVTRAGCGSWLVGNMLYTLVVALLYVLFLLVMSLIPLLPVISWNLDWGKIWGTLARTDSGWEFGVLLSIDDSIRIEYTALQALGVQFVLEWACVTFLGMLVYVGNCISGKQAGLWLAAFCVFFDITIYNVLSVWHNKYSPVSLARLSRLNGAEGLTIPYAFAFFGIGILILATVCYLSEMKTYRRRLSKEVTT